MLLLTGAVQAGERIVLTNGSEIHADRHELAGDTVRLFFQETGVTELPAALIAEYHAEEFTAPPASAAPTTALEASAKPAHTLSTREMVQAAVASQQLPPELVALVDSVIRQESGFHADAISPKGAIGLMQLMPGTARQLGVDPHDPAQNIEAGTRYLTALLKKYESIPDEQVVRALAAYNAGPGAVDKYRGVPPYPETREYVRRVVKNYLAEQKATASSAANPSHQ